MWELRLLLILIGVVAVAGIYLFSRQRLSRSRDYARTAPAFHESDPAASVMDGSKPLAQQRQTRAVPAAGKMDRQLILALHVTPRAGASFSGTGLLAAMHNTGLKFGNFQVFHRLTGTGIPRSVFSVANMMEPGGFDPQALPQATIPGLTLFMVLPGPRDGVAAYADMLATARGLARCLDGEVLDESRSTLTRQTAHYIRERILEFQRQPQLAP